MRHGLKKGLHWAGSALAIAGIAFVALRLRDYGGQIDFSRFSVVDWSIVGSFALIYGLSNLMLALAWWSLLGQFGASTSRRWAVRTYGISQLARYVPGNIFHLAGRQAMGLAAGVPGLPLAKSSIWELGLITLTGAVFSVLALPLVIATLPVLLGASTFVLAVSTVAAVLRRYLGPAVARAFGWYLGFIAISGALFVGLVEVVSADSVGGSLHWIPLCGAYVLAWLAGLMTPGAPAGAGVRELVLLFLINGFVGEVELLLAVVLGRAVTVGGDLVFFMIASLLNNGENARAEL